MALIELTQEDISEINSKSPNIWQENEQGIFTEPFGVDKIKEPVIYMRWETGGVSGGSCWDTSNPQYYSKSGEAPSFTALYLVLRKLCPTLSYLDYKIIESKVVSTEKTEFEYYGNRTDFGIKYIKLSDVYEVLKSIEYGSP